MGQEESIEKSLEELEKEELEKRENNFKNFIDYSLSCSVDKSLNFFDGKGYNAECEGGNKYGGNDNNIIINEENYNKSINKK
jgi:hypothetical protein